MEIKNTIYVPDCNVSFIGLKNALNIQGYDIVKLDKLKEDTKRNKTQMIKDEVKDGGYAVGPSHDEGGIPGYVKTTGQTIEFEGGESIINKRSMSMNEKVVCEGTPKGVASAVNMLGGGVKFSEEGTCKIVSGDGVGTTSEEVYDKNKDKLEKKSKIKAEEGYYFQKPEWYQERLEQLKKYYGWYKPLVEGKIYEIIDEARDKRYNYIVYHICIQREINGELKDYCVVVEITYEGKDNEDFVRTSGKILRFSDENDYTNVPPIVLAELNKLGKEFIEGYNQHYGSDYYYDYFNVVFDQDYDPWDYQEDNDDIRGANGYDTTPKYKPESEIIFREGGDIYEAANGMNIESKPIIGEVKTKELEFSVVGGGSMVLEPETYMVVQVYNHNGHKYYVTNKWYKKYKQVPLIIVDDIVDKYTPY